MELPFDIEDKPKTQFEPGTFDRMNLPPYMVRENLSAWDLKSNVYNCRACDGLRHCKPMTLKNFESNIMVIGEHPSHVDVSTPEGRLLAETLQWAGYSLDQVYLTSIIKCEESTQPDRCQHFLISELLIVQPMMILALGYEAGKIFDENINKPGYTTTIMNRYDMISTYSMPHAMASQQQFQEFLQHVQMSMQRIQQRQAQIGT